MNVLIDTNVMLDFLAKREPYFNEANTIVKKCISGEIKGYVASHSIINTFYILRKDYTPEERRKMLMKFITIVPVVGIDSNKIITSLKNSEFNDFEDCLQDQCAIECKADYIITRNIKDFKNSNIKALTPEEFNNL